MIVRPSSIFDYEGAQWVDSNGEWHRVDGPSWMNALRGQQWERHGEVLHHTHDPRWEAISGCR